MQHFHIALALIWREGRVLAALRRDDAEHLPGLWEFPGGKCHDGETPHQCAIREAWEEVGVEVEVIANLPPIHHEYSQRCVTLHPFDCRIISGEPQPLACAALRWMAVKEINDDDFPVANVALLQAIKARRVL